MKTVPLYGPKAAGRVALVDDRDYDFVMQYHWGVWEVPEKNQGPYAQGRVGAGRGAPYAYMHKLITGWPLTDHADHNGLNNQRYNLRQATDGQNRANQMPIRRRVSEFKGVGPRYGRWAARLKVSGRTVNLGVYDSEIEAALAYDAGARHHFGEFACPNFPDPPESLSATRQPRLCIICGDPVDPIDFCAKCSDLGQKCDAHPRPRRRRDAVTCGVKKCRNALRFLKEAS